MALDSSRRALEERLMARVRARQGEPDDADGKALREAPLSFAQRRLLFLYEMDPQGVDYLVPIACRIRGAVQIQALEASLNHLVRRHYSLRTRFDRDASGEPIQIVADPWPVQLAATNLRGPGNPDRKNSNVRALVEAELNTPFDLAAGRPMRAALAQLPDDEYLLLLVLHHIVCDGWSADVLVRDLCAMYAAETGLSATTELPTPPIQYTDFAVEQRQWLTGEELNRQLSYWRERLVLQP
jgi:Condensation domain